MKSSLYAKYTQSVNLDGFIARKTNTASKPGETLDSIADFVLIAIMLTIFIPLLTWENRMLYWIAAIALVRFASLGIGAVKYHAPAFLHTYANKMTGIVCACFSILYHGFGLTVTVCVLCGTASLSALEELIISASSKTLNQNVNSLFSEVSRRNDHKSFWNRYVYDFEINRFSGKAYEQIYRLMAQSLSPDMDVLEAATGTGLIALGIAAHVRHVEAADFSPEMIAAANRKNAPSNVRFSVGDATALPFANGSFDAAIISNALHIMLDPVKALAEISRVLKPDGLLIAPTYSHGHLRESTWNLNAKILKLIVLGENTCSNDSLERNRSIAFSFSGFFRLTTSYNSSTT